MQDKNKNYWIDELKKCIGKQISVADNFENKFSGICKAINFMHMNIVLMTKTEKIIVKNPQVIRRARENPDK